MNKQHVKNQHYVPQFLLRNFSTDGKHIWCYDKQTKRANKRNIRSIASEHHFYDIDPGSREGSYEYLLGKAESDTAPVIDKLIKTNTLTALKTADFVLISLFIALQLNRTKTALTEVEEFNSVLMDRVKALAASENATLGFEERSAREVWFSLLNSTPEFAIGISQKIWFLIGSDHKFLLSDHPVVRYNTANENSNRGTLGINSKGIEIYFPISPSLMLLLLCEKTYGFLEGKSFPITEENLNHMNGLQVAYSHRYIFSLSDNFSFVDELISSGAISKRTFDDQ